MGHISTDTVIKLVKDHLVNRIELNEPQDTIRETCKSCLYSKMTQKPISKELELEASRKIRDEIHTDIRGLAPVETL